MDSPFIPVTSDSIVIRDAGEGPIGQARHEDPSAPPDSAVNARQVNPTKTETNRAPAQGNQEQSSQNLPRYKMGRMAPVTERIETQEEQEFSPARYKMQINQAGRVTLEPRDPAESEQQAAEASGETPEDVGTTADTEGVEASAPVDIPQADGAGQGINEQMRVMQNTILQLTHHMSMLTQQVAGRNAVPETDEPAEPEYAQYDLSEPEQLHAYVQQQIQKGIREAITPTNNQLGRIEAQRQISDLVQAYGQDAFNAREPLLAELAKANPGTSAKEIWAIADKVLGPLTPKPAPATKPAAQPARTITAEQAKQKQQQAAKLPRSNTGVSGVGKAGLPANIRKFGDILAYNMMTGRAGN